MTAGPVLCMDDAHVREAISMSERSPDVAASRSLAPAEFHVMTSAVYALPRRRVESTTYDGAVVVAESRGNGGFEPTTESDVREMVRGAVKVVGEGGWLAVVAGEEAGEEAGEAAGVTTSSVRSVMVMLGLKGVEVRGGVVWGQRVGKKAAERIVVPAATAAGTATRVVIGVDDDDDDDDDGLIDEEELLGAGGVGEAVTADKASACGSRAACANCTCGRAEGKVTKLTKEMLENPQSGGCGSCSLGDAFRCAGCPYRGLPSFKPGEKIALPGDYLLDDL